MTVPAKARFTHFDKLWLWMLLACVGEAFEDEAEICGCVASVRKGGDKVALWTRTATADAVQKRMNSSTSSTGITSHLQSYITTHRL